MGLFYPTTFGIVGQKMTSLQHRSQGDSEDPHDEHYLLATQNKQDQVRKEIYSLNEIYSYHLLGILIVLLLSVSSISPPNLLQIGRLFPDRVDVWRVR